jgi:hypothetical protein
MADKVNRTVVGNATNITDKMLEARYFTDAIADEQKGWELVEECPECSSITVVRLKPDWWKGTGPIPIVGCGNPWHYAILSLGDSPDG